MTTSLAHLLKTALAFTMSVLGICRLSRWWFRDRLLVLTYHGVLPERHAADPFLSRNFVDAGEFRRQAEFIARHYRCIPLRDAVALLRSGRPLPARTAAITFDDGFRNNLTVAAPILRDCGLSATVFVVAGCVGHGTTMLWTERVAWLMQATRVARTSIRVRGRDVELVLDSPASREASARRLLDRLKELPVVERAEVVADVERRLEVADLEPDPMRYAFMDRQDLQALVEAGFDVGSHTVDHALLATCSAEQRWREVSVSKEMLERATGTACSLFAFPNGRRSDFDAIDKENLARAGYLGAVTQMVRFNEPGCDPFELRRINISMGHAGWIFRARVSGIWPFLAPQAARRKAPQPAAAPTVAHGV